MSAQALAVPIRKRMSYQGYSTVFTISLFGMSGNEHTNQVESVLLPG